MIQPDQDAGWVAPNPTIQLCYDLSLAGIGFDQDNRQAWQLIQRWTIHDPIYNWLKPFELTEDGRGAWLALKAQMEGVAAINSRANQANRILGMGQGSALWTNEYSSPFMSYATTLQHAEVCSYRVKKQKFDNLTTSSCRTFTAYIINNIQNQWIIN